MFVIVYKDDLECPIILDIYATRFQAETFMRQNFSRPWLYAVREATWQERERNMFLHDLYQDPCWRNESFCDVEEDHPTFHHYAHVSLVDPTKIAFTENDDKGRRDIQASMKPGKYLKRFFPDMDAKKIAYYAEWWASGTKPAADFGVLELKFAKSESEIIQVYEDGPDSCMKGHDCVRVYASGDLAVAYLQQQGTNRIIARSLVAPERKVFGRIYPNTENWDEDGFDSEDESASARNHLRDMLRGEGYQSLQEQPAGFTGCKLLTIKHDVDDSDKAYVMPYLDNGMMLRLEGQQLVLDPNGEFCSDTTDGWCYLENAPSFYCWACDNAVHDHEPRHLFYRSHNMWGPTNTEEICERCATNTSLFYRCAIDRVRYALVHGQSIGLFDGRVVHQRHRDNLYVDQHGRTYINQQEYEETQQRELSTV